MDTCLVIVVADGEQDLSIFLRAGSGLDKIQNVRILGELFLGSA